MIALDEDVEGDEAKKFLRERRFYEATSRRLVTLQDSRVVSPALFDEGVRVTRHHTCLVVKVHCFAPLSLPL